MFFFCQKFIDGDCRVTWGVVVVYAFCQQCVEVERLSFVESESYFVIVRHTISPYSFFKPTEIRTHLNQTCPRLCSRCCSALASSSSACSSPFLFISCTELFHEMNTSSIIQLAGVCTWASTLKRHPTQWCLLPPDESQYIHGAATSW